MKSSFIIEFIIALVLSATVTVAFDEPNSSSTISEQLWITNAHGDYIHIYEVGTWKLVDKLQVGPSPHGISATAVKYPQDNSKTRQKCSVIVKHSGL